MPGSESFLAFRGSPQVGFSTRWCQLVETLTPRPDFGDFHVTEFRWPGSTLPFRRSTEIVSSLVCALFATPGMCTSRISSTFAFSKRIPSVAPGSSGKETLLTVSVPSPALSLSRLEPSVRPTSLPVCCPSVGGRPPAQGLPPCLGMTRPPIQTPGLWHLVLSPGTSGHQ